MPDLDQHLDATRANLLRQIEIPELAAVQARATRIRRRRRGVVAAASLALLVVIGTGAALLDGGRLVDTDRGPAPAESFPAGSVWRGSGLTLLGLNGDVLDQPGTLTDVQFADADHGYALTALCDRGAGRPCAVAVAATRDGGRTWVNWPPPLGEAPPDRLPALVALGSDRLVIVGESEAWFGRYGSEGWTTLDLAAVPPAVAAVADGGRLWFRKSPDGCAADALNVWQTDGTLVRLAEQPKMTVCSVAPAPAADGAWWVGGRAADGTAPAVGVSRDAGRTWSVIVLPAGDGEARLSALGAHVFATVVSPRGGDPYPETLIIRMVYRSVSGGPFTPYATGPTTVIGDVVPLLDGRLVAVDSGWEITTGAGTAFGPAGGSMPWVHRLQRTPGGWIAYDLFRGGWAAISQDGETWQKINVR